MKLKCERCGKEVEVSDQIVEEGKQRLYEMARLRGIKADETQTKYMLMCKNCLRPSYIG